LWGTISFWLHSSVNPNYTFGCILYSNKYNLGLLMTVPPKLPALARIYAWFSAVVNNDIDFLDGLLAHGVPIDSPHPLRHSTALMEATRLGRAGMVQCLLDRGAAPAFLCGLPLGTSLHCALRRHHWDIAAILANAMSHCAVMDAYGATPLHLLCAETTPSMEPTIPLGLATLFLHKNCPLNALDQDGTTALHHCIINDHLPLASMLLNYGANPNALIPDSQVSPLAIAALEKNLPLARLLLHYGADPHIRTREGSSPIALYPAIAPLVTRALEVRGKPQMQEAANLTAAQAELSS
jgi:ankyrin repeat protein